MTTPPAELPQPTEPWAPVEAAAMAQPEFAIMAATTAAVLRRLTRLWVTLYGSIGTLPGTGQNSRSLSGRDAGLALTGTGPASRLGTFAAHSRRRAAVSDVPAIDFPPVWADAVDAGVQEIIDAMDAAADSVTREVPAADTARARAYRAERVRRAVAPSQIAKRGFAAVLEATAQPARLESDVRGVVVGELVADHTEQQLEQAASLGDDWVCIWVAERDACVRCLAYQGLYVTPAAGQLFPGGRTWGPRWKSVIGRSDFRGPGWREAADGEHEGSHPHCRCELRVVRRTNVRLLATGLKREAARSAAKGWARPTEGDTVRVAAARHVLAKKATLPRSVVDETRRRLRTPGAFPRRVPSPNR
jgi:hypothetical protein